MNGFDLLRMVIFAALIFYILSEVYKVIKPNLDQYLGKKKKPKKDVEGTYNGMEKY